MRSQWKRGGRERGPARGKQTWRHRREVQHRSPELNSQRSRKAGRLSVRSWAAFQGEKAVIHAGRCQLLNQIGRESALWRLLGSLSGPRLQMEPPQMDWWGAGDFCVQQYGRLDILRTSRHEAIIKWWTNHNKHHLNESLTSQESKGKPQEPQERRCGEKALGRASSITTWLGIDGQAETGD